MPSAPDDSSGPDTAVEESAAVESANSETQSTETGNTKTPIEPAERRLPPLRPAPVVRAREQQRQQQRPPQQEPEHEQPLREPLSERGPRVRSVTQAIEQVNEIIAELKHALEEMDDILETLELAERQKIDDEREIENLQGALRRLNRPRDGDQRDQRS